MTNIFDKMPKDIVGIEDRNRYDGVAYWEDKEWNRYSRNGNPIKKNELSKYGKIYEVEQIIDGPWQFEYHYKILSVRPDTDESEEGIQENR